MWKYILITVLVFCLVFGITVLADPSNGIDPAGSVRPTFLYSRNIGAMLPEQYSYNASIHSLPMLLS